MNFNSYTLILCLIVYVGLVALFATTIVIITKQTLKLMRVGVEDEKIKTEYLKNKGKKQSVIMGIINLVIPVVACAVMLTLFIGSVIVGALSDNKVGDVPVMKVVTTASMASKNEKNEYLFDNEINDQLQVYDIIFAHKLPDEKDLKQYDIVLYEVEPGVMIIHRIVNIEEPNEKHPNERWFQLQGDSVQYPDKFPVKYSQMKGIYRGDRIPFIGSLVVFMQSTAGVLCVMLVVFAAIVMPFLEKKFRKETMLRLVSMGLISSEETSNSNDVQDAPNQQTTIEQPLYYMAATADTDGVGNAWYDSLKGKKGLTFRQKHDLASKEVLARYKQIVIHLYKIKGLHVWEGKQCETYKKGRTPICKIAFRGKSFSVYLALNPAEYENTKYIYTQTTAKSYKDYPMAVKVTSDRQAKWVCELISDLANKNGLYMYAISKLLTIKGTDKTLEERLLSSSENTKNWFKQLTEYLLSIDGIRVISSKKQISYKIKNKNIAKLKMVGKTLNLYLALEPKKFKNTKYKFIDVSAKKVHAKYPMRVKITSDRQAKWALELIEKI
ncbi:MAG: hypothetical protein IKV61_03625 [Clostridia bacterium]|nr:hypothetical protein [Clostridia bacterium]